MKIKKCPFCGSENLSVGNFGNYIKCINCGTAGPDGSTLNEAFDKWNAAPRKEDVEMKKSCGSCKYNQDGYCSAVPPYKSFPVDSHLCCTDWAAKEPKSTPLTPSNSRGLYDGRNDCDYPNLSGGCHVFPAGKPFVDSAEEALDVIRTLETKVNEYQMAAEEAAELAQAMLK